MDVNVLMPEVFEYAYDWLINISIFTTRLNAKTVLKNIQIKPTIGWKSKDLLCSWSEVNN